MIQDSNPSPLYFECGMCGECCSSWQIPLEGGKAARLLARPWVQARLTETRRELLPLSDDFYRIPLTDENVCVFLASDRRCMVELHEGASLKPDECRRFPFATVRLPDGGTGHEASAACKKISEKLLLAFQPVLPKPSASANSLSETQDNPPQGETDMTDLPPSVSEDEPLAILPETIPIGLLGSLSIAGYERWRASLHEIFTRPDILPEQALREAKASLKFFSKRDRTTRQPGSPPGMHSRNPHSDRRFHPLVAQMMMMLFLRKPYRTLSGIQLLCKRFYHDPRVFGGPVDLREQRRIRWNADYDPLLNAFLYSILLRRRPLACSMSLSSLLAMASVACLLTQWHAATLAWLQGKDSPGRTDVTGAIRLVERYYTGHQPRFMRFFVPRIRGAALEALLLSLFLPWWKQGSPVREAPGIG